MLRNISLRREFDRTGKFKVKQKVLHKREYFSPIIFNMGELS